MIVSNSLCIVCDTNVSCHFFAVFAKMKDSRCAEEFVSASPILTGRIRTLDGLGSFGQKMSAIFFRTIWPQAMLQNVNTITAFSFVASPLTYFFKEYIEHRRSPCTRQILTSICPLFIFPTVSCNIFLLLFF